MLTKRKHISKKRRTHYVINIISSNRSWNAVLTGIGAGLGIGKATSSAVDAIARQPEAESKISKSLLLGCALAEATAIYGFVIALLIILFLK